MSTHTLICTRLHQGPRVRDRLAHGELDCVPVEVASRVLALCACVCSTGTELHAQMTEVRNEILAQKRHSINQCFFYSSFFSFFLSFFLSFKSFIHSFFLSFFLSLLHSLLSSWDAVERFSILQTTLSEQFTLLWRS